MIHVIAATYEDGVFKPDEHLELPPSTRVRLAVEPLQGDTEATRREAWETLERLWRQSIIDSRGERLSRTQLHERR